METPDDIDAELPAFAFTTQRRPLDSTAWEPGPQLLVHIDRGEGGAPEHLSWRGLAGAESAIVFQDGMTDFYGYHRGADGALAEFRGERDGRSALPDGARGGLVHRFRTEEGDSGGWHPSGELRLLVDHGGQPVERVAWRDRQGNAGSVALRSTASTGAGEVTNLVSVVRASSEHPQRREIGANLIDATLSKWFTFMNTAWLIFNFAEPVAVTSYALMSANDLPDRDPTEWTLSGSSDRNRWRILDQRTGQLFTERFQTRSYGFTNTTAYRYYRLEISDNAGSHDLQLAQVRFFSVGSGGFVGYYQHAGEGAIGYRGTPIFRPVQSSTEAARATAFGASFRAGNPAWLLDAGELLQGKLAMRASALQPGITATSATAAGRVAAAGTVPAAGATQAAGHVAPAIPTEPAEQPDAEPKPGPAVAAIGHRASIVGSAGTDTRGQRGRLANLAQQHLSPADAEKWIGLLRPALGLGRTVDGPVIGQLGGLPRLPPEVGWPVWEKGQGPLKLIAFIDFAALPCHELDIPLPSSGILHFFYFDDQIPGATATCDKDEPFRHGGTRLLYVPAGIPVDERPAPSAIEPYPVVSLRAEPIITAPDAFHSILRDTFGKPGVSPLDAHDVFGDDFVGAVLEEKRHAHQIGGYSHPEQWPPEGCLESSTLLAQFGTDHDADMQWGDLGSLYWVIKPDDLAARRFEGAQFRFQCL